MGTLRMQSAGAALEIGNSDSMQTKMLKLIVMLAKHAMTCLEVCSVSPVLPRPGKAWKHHCFHQQELPAHRLTS